MGFRKIKRDPADSLFSTYIRYRDEWTCQRCLKRFEPGATNLHNSHFWTRGREAVRFDETNCDALCSFCHEALGKDPADYYHWKLNQLGQAAFDRLTVRANCHSKKDRKGQLLYWRERLRREFPEALKK